VGAAIAVAAAGIILWLLKIGPFSQPKTETKTTAQVESTKPAINLPATRPLDSGSMVLVEAGPALLGEEKKQVYVPAFYIDVTEVTNGSYLKFCHETQYAPPPSAQTDLADYPVVNVSFYDAEAYAHLAKKRLPTAAEWEKAARGEKGRPFPWGEEWRDGAANIPLDKNARKTTRLASAASFASGVSPYGALNMLGNAWEWVNEPASLDEHEFEMLQKFSKIYAPPLVRSEPFYQARGGSFHFLPPETKSDLIVDSLTLPARDREPDVGFRCAQDP
jgi:formylglycine-generating enzyme required for sulfatase activity